MYCSERKTDVSLIVNTMLFTIIFVIINNKVTNILWITNIRLTARVCMTISVIAAVLRWSFDNTWNWFWVNAQVRLYLEGNWSEARKLLEGCVQVYCNDKFDCLLSWIVTLNTEIGALSLTTTDLSAHLYRKMGMVQARSYWMWWGRRNSYHQTDGRVFASSLPNDLLCCAW